MEFIKLFEPITINGLEIKNRIVMPAMGLSYTTDYTFNDRYQGFYRTRARGGVGLMFIGPLAIDQVGSAPLMPGLFDDRNDESLAGFLDELHRTTSAKVGTQLFHMGRYAYSFLTGHTPIAPSPVPSKLTRETPREMTIEDIEQVKESFARAALKARKVGFDYIEVIACTGYLISQFLSPVTNHRTDQYGGSVENRMRFGLEVIQKVRAALGPDVPMGVRIAGHDYMEGGNTNKEAAQFAAAAEKAGANAINVTGGWHETNVPQLTTNVPRGMYLYLARGVKNQVQVPVFASNRLGDPELAEMALRTGSADMICWGRPLITDPELPNKARTGRLDQAVYCIACNQGCFDSIFSGTAVHCVLNPLAGRENEFSLDRTRSPQNILVAGGGPAGMEFALAAASQGHRVTLFEKEQRLGGQINLAMVPPGKEELGGIVRSLAARMKQAGVEVVLGQALTADRVRELKPDLLVVATGARPISLQVPGVDRPHVFDAWDVLQDKVPHIGSKVVIVGGSATGCETAHYITSLNAADPAVYAFLMYHNAEDPRTAMDMLHNPGREVTVIDVVDRMAANVGRTQRWSLMKSLRLMGVRLLTGTGLVEITDDAVIVDLGGRREAIPADTVIMAVGARPLDELSREVQESGLKTITIGDAKKTRCITDAIREGFEEAVGI
jgi:2,4-dienoyl-CoA reductase (NADPH2)